MGTLTYFHEFLKQYAELTEEDLAVVQNIAEEKSFPKNSVLVESGKVCPTLFFIKKGAVRSYFLADGKEVTYWFSTEKMFATSYYSFISRKIGFETLQCLEDTEAVCIDYEELQSALSKSHRLETLWRKVSEQYYIQLEERAYNFQKYSAKERYGLFVQRNADWLLRFSLGYIASYLGISQETLSRIRAKK